MARAAFSQSLALIQLSSFLLSVSYCLDNIILSLTWFHSSRQPAINARQSFGETQHVVNNGVAHFAVEVAEFGFGVFVNGDAARG